MCRTSARGGQETKDASAEKRRAPRWPLGGGAYLFLVVALARHFDSLGEEAPELSGYAQVSPCSLARALLWFRQAWKLGSQLLR